MTIAIALIATAVVAGVIAFDLRRQARLLTHARQILRAAGDDGVPPATIDHALERLERRVSDLPGGDPALTTVVRTVIDAMPTGAVVADPGGVELFRNRSAAPYASGRHGDALVEVAIKAAVRAAAGGEETIEELDQSGPPERSLVVAGSPLVDDGVRLGAIVLIEDVTEHHRIDAVRRDFIANVSHELRTPVGALSLLAETLEGETDPEVVERFIGRIREEADRLTALIDDLLDLSRIEGGLGAEVETITLEDIGLAAVAATRAHAAHRSIEVRLELGDAATASVHGDRAQLVSALTNLVDNAVRYTHADTDVVIRFAAHADEVAISVVDEGVGIPSRDQSRVFERFYRADRGRARHHGGTGLGLSIVKRIAVNHGGRVELASQEGVGSTFTIILPAAAALDEPFEPAVERGEHRG